MLALHDGCKAFPYQDKKYGNGWRVVSLTKDWRPADGHYEVRCSVCGKEFEYKNVRVGEQHKVN